MSGLQAKVARGSLANVFGNGFRVVVSFIQTVLVAKWLGVEGYGHVSLILSYTSFLHYLFMLGFDHTLPLFLVNSSEASDEKPREILIRSIYLSLFAATVILLGLGLSAFAFLRGTDREVLLIPGIIIAVQMELSALGYILGAYFRSFRLFADVIIREQFIFPITSLLGMVLFIKILDFGVLGYAWGFFSASVLALLYMLVTIQKVIPPKQGKSETEFLHRGWKKQLLFSIPVGLMATLEPVFNYSTVVVSSWQLTDAELGYLGVCTRLGFFLTLALLALNPIFTPFLASLKQEKNLEEFKSLYQKVIFWCLSWALLASFVFAMFSKEVLSVFGADFIPASGVFLAMLPGLFFEGAFGATKLSLVMAGHNMINMVNLMVATALNVVCIYLGNHYFGILGGAIGFSITLILLNLIRLAQMQMFYRILPLSFERILPIVLSCVLLSCGVLWNFSIVSSQVSRFVVTALLSLVCLLILVWKDRGLFIMRLRK